MKGGIENQGLRQLNGAACPGLTAEAAKALAGLRRGNAPPLR
jgi:hypothetical protein